MTKVLVFPTKYASISVGDVDYKPNKDGMVLVEDDSHIPNLVRFGAVDPSSVIVFADDPVPGPSGTLDATPGTDIAPAPAEAFPTPSGPTPGGIVGPVGDASKAELVEWLAQNGVAVSPHSTKANLWLAVREFLAEK